MGKKITRRIVLGTTVAALAVGPFVIRHFRRGRTLDLPERKSAFRGSVKKRPVNVVIVPSRLVIIYEKRKIA